MATSDSSFAPLPHETFPNPTRTQEPKVSKTSHNPQKQSPEQTHLNFQLKQQYVKLNIVLVLISTYAASQDTILQKNNVGNTQILYTIIYKSNHQQMQHNFGYKNEVHSTNNEIGINGHVDLKS